MLEEFLARFYDTISFAAGESFPSRDFRILFRPDALLLEQTEGGTYAAKTLDEYIREFETAVRDNPQLFVEGFRERQTDMTWTRREDVFRVHSSYEKRYARGGAPVLETGTNHMTIVAEGGKLCIACVIW